MLSFKPTHVKSDRPELARLEALHAPSTRVVAADDGGPPDVVPEDAAAAAARDRRAEELVARLRKHELWSLLRSFGW